MLGGLNLDLPGFEALVTQARQAGVKESVAVSDLPSKTQTWGSFGRFLNKDFETKWHTVQVAGSHAGSSNCIDVCNLDRLKILLLELRMRGFACAARAEFNGLWLDICMALCKDAYGRDVTIQGIDA